MSRAREMQLRGKGVFRGGLVVMVLLGLVACSGNADSLRRDKERCLMEEQAHRTVSLALQYHDQGSYEKSTDLFMDAANIYVSLNDDDAARRSLLAAAKCQLKCSRTQDFLVTMSRYRRYVDPLKMPTEEERLMVNLADHMQKKPLSFPGSEPWQMMFQ